MASNELIDGTASVTGASTSEGTASITGHAKLAQSPPLPVDSIRCSITLRAKSAQSPPFVSHPAALLRLQIMAALQDICPNVDSKSISSSCSVIMCHGAAKIGDFVLFVPERFT